MWRREMGFEPPREDDFSSVAHYQAMRSRPNPAVAILRLTFTPILFGLLSENTQR